MGSQGCQSSYLVQREECMAVKGKPRVLLFAYGHLQERATQITAHVCLRVALGL